jgi:hypothetical protein
VHLLTNLDAKDVIEQLLTAAGVERIVSVDDSYSNKFPVEDFLGLSSEFELVQLHKVFAEHPSIIAVTDREIWAQKVREVWRDLDEPTRQELTRKIRELIREKTGTMPAASSGHFDYETVTILPSLFAKYGLLTMSLKDWQKQKDDILKSDMPLTLILVDEDFSGEGASPVEGIKVIKELFKATKPEKVLCALLSQKYGSVGIHDQWKALCTKEDLDPSKFVLIPKAFLEVEQDLLGFGRLVKLAILNESVNELRKKATAILDGAIQEAEKQLNGIDVYDFDQIVFLSSYLEGVWEPDTLFRIFGLFHRDETRRLAKGNAELHKLVDEIRKVSQIPTKSESAPNYNTIKLQRLELYEDPEFLNSHYMPIELGDIFGKTGSKQLFILLGQPCDLMVRSDGRRNPSVNEAALVEIKTGEFENHEGYVELPFFDSDGTTKHYVAFRSSVAVDLMALDLCAFHSNGESEFKCGCECPKTLIPAWRTHYEHMAGKVTTIIDRVDGFAKLGMNPAEAEYLVARCSNHKSFKPTVHVKQKILRYSVKRVGRLRKPRAAALLSQYANFLARFAFEHDLGERKEKSPGATDAGSSDAGAGEKAATSVAESGSSDARTPEDTKTAKHRVLTNWRLVNRCKRRLQEWIESIFPLI